MISRALTTGLLVSLGAVMITGSLCALEPIRESAPDCSIEADAVAAEALARGRQQVLDCVRSIGGEAFRAAEECDY
jgi:hypothetical protein